MGLPHEPMTVPMPSAGAAQSPRVDSLQNCRAGGDEPARRLLRNADDIAEGLRSLGYAVP